MKLFPDRCKSFPFKEIFDSSQSIAAGHMASWRSWTNETAMSTAKRRISVQSFFFVVTALWTKPCWVREISNCAVIWSKQIFLTWLKQTP